MKLRTKINLLLNVILAFSFAVWVSCFLQISNATLKDRHTLYNFHSLLLVVFIVIIFCRVKISKYLKTAPEGSLSEFNTFNAMVKVFVIYNVFCFYQIYSVQILHSKTIYVATALTLAGFAVLHVLCNFTARLIYQFDVNGISDFLISSAKKSLKESETENSKKSEAEDFNQVTTFSKLMTSLAKFQILIATAVVIFVVLDLTRKVDAFDVLVCIALCTLLSFVLGVKSYFEIRLKSDSMTPLEINNAVQYLLAFSLLTWIVSWSGIIRTTSDDIYTTSGFILFVILITITAYFADQCNKLNSVLMAHSTNR